MNRPCNPRVICATSPLAALLLVLAVLLPGMTGCKALTTEYPVDRTVDADSERILWNALRVAIDKNGYKVGAGARSERREIQSGWKLDLAPFKSRGFRTRVIASYEPSLELPLAGPDSGYEAFDVTIRVEKETNESLSPLNLDRAVWTPADDDPQVARRIMQVFHGLLGTSEFGLEDRGSILDIE